MRRERAARMEVLGYSDIEIATAIGLTPAGLAMLKRSPQYQDILISVKNGFVRDMDSALGEHTELLRTRIRDHIPNAINTIIDMIQQRADKKLALTAAETLIGMDGRFAKVTRVGVPTEAQGGVGTEDDAIVKGIMRGIERKRNEELEAQKSQTETVQ